MKAHEVREMKENELIKRIAEEEKNIIDLRFAHQLKQLTNTAKLKMAKSDIARMKTILKEKRSAESVSADANEGVTA
ncbi:MAG TPA: 50S ribosomal protein L29 [Ignavibacteria bacterium]|nr:50S ribosomal protein L29 [Ignavibacteria bacterium]